MFKYPRPGTGEHWAEKIAAEIAHLLEIPCAKTELAVFQETRGSASESFIGEYQNLFAGNEILASHAGDYDPARRFDQSRHTLQNIWLALERLFELPQGAESAKARFAGFLVLDAVIGNTDRHHENWGVARRRTVDGWVGYLAESFDHASSLGRELRDTRRDGLIANNRIGFYSENGSGGIYWLESDEDGPSPLQLVRFATKAYPELLGPTLAQLPKLDAGVLIEIVSCIPNDWMTDTAKQFVIALIEYNLRQLRLLL